MTTPQQGSGEPIKNGSVKGSAKANGKTDFKILMLHGYTQSGPLFRSKTGALSKLLVKALSPAPYNLNPVLIYPTGPHRLRPSDIPGYVPPGGDGGSGAGAQDQDEDETDNWAWFRRDEASGSYRGFAAGMDRIAETIRENGGVDGVIGFSQGGATAALVTAAMETERPIPGASSSSSPTSSSPEEYAWARELRDANGGRALQFAVIYSGFFARDADLEWLYDGGIGTKTLHFLGGLDTVVEESRSRGLAERCKEGTSTVVVHPGGHYVPVSKEWTGVLVGWLRQVLDDGKRKQDEQKL